MHSVFGQIPKSWWWAFSVALTALVIALSTAPGNPQPGDSAFVWAVDRTPTAIQKSMHVAVYALLYVAWTLTLSTYRSGRASRTGPAAAAAIILFGAILEYIQLWIPGRFGTLIDVGLNAAGVAIGAMMLRTGLAKRLCGPENAREA